MCGNNCLSITSCTSQITALLVQKGLLFTTSLDEIIELHLVTSYFVGIFCHLVLVETVIADILLIILLKQTVFVSSSILA